MTVGLPRTTIILLHDVLVAGASFLLAFWLSHGGQLHQIESGALGYGTAVSALTAAACCYACRLHRRVWSYTSLADLIAVARTSTVVTLLVFLFAVLVIDGRPEIQGAAAIVQWFVMVVLLSTSRLCYRAAKDGGLSWRTLRTAEERVPVLIYGCGPWTSLFVRAAQSTIGVGLHIVGIVDDMHERSGRYFSSIPVLGPPADLERILVGLAVRGVHPRKVIVTRTPAEIPDPARAALAAARWRHGLEIDYLPNLLNAGATASAPQATGPGPAPIAWLRVRLERVAGGTARLHRSLGTMLAGDPPGHRLRPALARARRSLGRPAAARLPDPAAGAPPQPRLLVVNRYFHPDRSATAQLLTDLVEAAVEQGLATAVFASRQLYDEPGAGLPARDRHAGAEVHRLWATRSGRPSLPGRALDYATFCCSALLALLVAARPGDLILAKTDPPLLSVVAWAAARLKGARLVNWCQDLFPEAAAALGLRFATGTRGRLLRTLRNASLGGAALNVAVCESMARRLQAEGIAADRIAVIHNWADGARIRPLAREQNRLRRQWGLGDRFVIGYSGNLGRMHEVETLVELIDLLADEPELAFLLVGAGAGYERLRRRAGERDLGNVMLRPYQPPARLPESLTLPDLHVVSLRPDCEGLVMPSKLYGVLAAGRPVLAIGDPAGDVARLVRAHDAGLIVAPGAAAAAAAAIRALAADPARQAGLGANARAAYERAYSREASLAAWSRCLRPLLLPAARPLPEAVAAE